MACSCFWESAPLYQWRMIQLLCYSLCCWLTVYKWFNYPATVCTVDSLCTNDSAILLQFVLLTHCVQMIQLSCYSLYCWLTVYKWFSYPATVCTVDSLCTNDSAILLQFVLSTHYVQEGECPSSSLKGGINYAGAQKCFSASQFTSTAASLAHRCSTICVILAVVHACTALLRVSTSILTHGSLSFLCELIFTTFVAVLLPFLQHSASPRSHCIYTCVSHGIYLHLSLVTFSTLQVGPWWPARACGQQAEGLRAWAEAAAHAALSRGDIPIIYHNISATAIDIDTIISIRPEVRCKLTYQPQPLIKAQRSPHDNPAALTYE